MVHIDIAAHQKIEIALFAVDVRVELFAVEQVDVIAVFALLIDCLKVMPVPLHRRILGPTTRELKVCPGFDRLDLAGDLPAMLGIHPSRLHRFSGITTHLVIEHRVGVHANTCITARLTGAQELVLRSVFGAH